MLLLVIFALRCTNCLRHYPHTQRTVKAFRGLMEIQKCNDMVTYYKQKVQQLRNENDALEIEISSPSPANPSEKMQLQDEINNLIKDKQYLAVQLNTIAKNNKDFSRGYFPYTEVTKKITTVFPFRKSLIYETCLEEINGMKSLNQRILQSFFV